MYRSYRIPATENTFLTNIPTIQDALPICTKLQWLRSLYTDRCLQHLIQTNKHFIGKQGMTVLFIAIQDAYLLFFDM